MRLHSKILHIIKAFFVDMRFLAIWVVAALIVPNVMLSFTEDVSLASALANVLLPLGLYMILMGLWRRTGAMALLMIPFMCYAAFQIVLIYLYGGSVIAVDMFLNVVTTNVSEATELLGNLAEAMGLVFLLYLPPIIWGIIAAWRRLAINNRFSCKMVRSGAIAMVAGAVMSITAFFTGRDYSPVHEIFPVNAISNMVEAFHRYGETSRQPEISADFTYHAVDARDDSEPEAYIFVVGETARGDNWQLGGYDRPTNPLLAKEEGLTFFHRSISESNTTHKSVPMLISFASAETFDSIAHYKSILTAFKEAGFATAFISNQRPNRSFTEHFGSEADTTIYLIDGETGMQPFDAELIPKVEKLLEDSTRRKQLIVLHTYGSHFLYYDRYPREFARFLPDSGEDASPANRSQLINAYDNTILYTDYLLAQLISRLKARDLRAALVYASDHGEDIFDDRRKRFLHASPLPTYWQLHQASLVWLSPKMIEQFPQAAEALQANRSKRISPQKSLFPTVMQLAGIASPYIVDSLSLVSPRYSPAPAVYVNDLNRTIPIERCGLKRADMELLAPLLQDK